MDKEGIKKATESAAAQARAIASMKGGEGWAMAVPIIEKHLAKFLKKVKASRKAGDYFCAHCETGSIMNEIENELESIVNKSLLTRG